MELEKLYEIYSNSGIVTTDSRNISKGSLYFALKGDNFDGNMFAELALKAGASIAVIDNKDYYIDHLTILVANTLETLQSLANYHRKKLQVPVIAITGTNGKTTTKELLNAVLSKKYKVLATKGNLNNHIGVPLTLLSITNDIEIAIVEMGANHQREIDFLSKIAEPTHALITNIGKAHLEGFGGYEGVIKAKKELYDYVIDKKGVIFYNSDDALLSNILAEESVKKYSYGNKTGDTCIGKVVPSDTFLNIEVNDKKSSVSETIKSQIVGEYNADNVMAAVCIGLYFSVALSEIVNAIGSYQPSNSRSQLVDTVNNKVILDCYNANPSSTLAALNNFGKMKGDFKTVILGDMLELGDEAQAEHENIIKYLLSMPPVQILLVGECYQKVADLYFMPSFKTSDELKTWLQINPITDNLILVKGSRGIKLEKIMEVL